MKRPVTSISLIFMLVSQPVPAQEAGAAARLTILEGEGAMNNVKLRTSRNLVVQLEDANKKPLSKVPVTFTVAGSGASGVFSNGSTTTTITTDEQGRAAARGFRPNSQAGKFEIRVNATVKGETAHATITQFNMAVSDPAPKKSSGTGKLIAIVAVVGGAAAAGGFVATRKSGTTAPPPLPTLTVTAGAGSVGPPP